MYVKNLTKDNILKEIKNIISIQNPEKRLEAYDLLAMKLGFNLTKSNDKNRSVTQFEGNSMKNTRPFKVNGPWEITHSRRKSSRHSS